MKQAILITAYKDMDHLLDLANFFDKDFSFYVHLDRKSNIKEEEITSLRQIENVRFVEKKYSVNWGGLNHLKAILFLATVALRDKENYYFHLISGSDFPIKTVRQFKEFFRKNQEKEFINFFEVPFAGWADNGGMDRLVYYNFYDFWNFKITRERYRIKRLLSIQKKFGLKRALSSKMPKLYGGSTWWSLSRNFLQYLIDFEKQNSYVLNRFKYTFCSEELYIQTVLFNSPFKTRVENNSLRHIEWVPRNGNNPAILDETDLEKLIQSDAFFARKFEKPTSQELLNRIKSFLNDRT